MHGKRGKCRFRLHFTLALFLFGANLANGQFSEYYGSNNVNTENSGYNSESSLFSDPIRRALGLWGRLLNRMAQTNPPTDDQLHLVSSSASNGYDEWDGRSQYRGGFFGNDGDGGGIFGTLGSSRSTADGGYLGSGGMIGRSGSAGGGNSIINEKKLLELLPRLKQGGGFEAGGSADAESSTVVAETTTVATTAKTESVNGTESMTPPPKKRKRKLTAKQRRIRTQKARAVARQRKVEANGEIAESEVLSPSEKKKLKRKNRRNMDKQTSSTASEERDNESNSASTTVESSTTIPTTLTPATKSASLATTKKKATPAATTPKSVKASAPKTKAVVSSTTLTTLKPQTPPTPTTPPAGNASTTTGGIVETMRRETQELINEIENVLNNNGEQWIFSPVALETTLMNGNITKRKEKLVVRNGTVTTLGNSTILDVISTSETIKAPPGKRKTTLKATTIKVLPSTVSTTETVPAEKHNVLKETVAKASADEEFEASGEELSDYTASPKNVRIMQKTPQEYAEYEYSDEDEDGDYSYEYGGYDASEKQSKLNRDSEVTKEEKPEIEAINSESAVSTTTTPTISSNVTKKSAKRTRINRNGIPEAEEEEQAGDISQLQLDSVVSLSSAGSAESIEKASNIVKFTDVESGAPSATSGIASSPLVLPPVDAVVPVRYANSIIDGIGPLILPLLGYSRRVTQTVSDFYPQRTSGVTVYRPNANTDYFLQSQQQAQPQPQTLEQLGSYVRMQQQKEQHQRLAAIRQQQLPPSTSVDSRHTVQTSNPSTVNSPNVRMSTDDIESSHFHHISSPDLIRPQIPNVRNRVINAETESKISPTSSTLPMRFMPDPASSQGETNPTVFASDAVRQALSNVLHQDRVQPMTTQEMAQSMLRQMLPPQLLGGGNSAQDATSSRDGFAEAFSQKQVAPAAPLRKLNSNDPGYDLGRSNVESTFVSDSGIMLSESAPKQPGNNPQKPSFSSFPQAETSAPQSNSQQNFPPSAQKISDGFGSGRRPDDSMIRT